MAYVAVRNPIVPTRLVLKMFPHLRQSSPPRVFAGGTSWLLQAAQAGGLAAEPLVPFVVAPSVLALVVAA